MKARHFFLFVFGIVSLTAPGVLAQTNVGGLICGDTTWDLAGSPYVVTSSVMVACGATLTIDPGVGVRFKQGLGLTVGHSGLGPGTLVARGIEGTGILFTSNDPYEGGVAEPGDWSRIYLTDHAVDAEFVDGAYVSGSILEYAIVEYAGGSGGAVTAQNSSPYIARCWIHDNAHTGIRIDASSAPSAKIEGCAISSNGVSGDGGGIHLSGGAGHLVAGNNVHDCSATGNGGGIWVDARTTLHGNTVTENSAYRGGGVYLHSSSDNSTLTNNTISENSSTYDGGGAYFGSSGNCDLTSNVVTNNTSGYQGGGLFLISSGGAELTLNTIAGNTATRYDGGGVYLGSSGTSTLESNAITGNGAGRNGGGLYFTSSGSSSLTGNIIEDNSSGQHAGGVYLYSSGSCALSMNAITGNTAGTGTGGGLYLYRSGSSTLASNTITGNTCGGEGGAIRFTESGSCTITDCEITGNHTTGGETGGIYVTDSTWLSFAGDPVARIYNRIYGNDGYCIYNATAFDAGGSADISARNVWWGWGNCDAGLISACIYDFFEDPSYGVVMFFPFTPPEASGDADWDTGVDLGDYAAFHACLTGPCGPDCEFPPAEACAVFDFDCDYDIDLLDFAEFGNLFTGPPG